MTRVIDSRFNQKSFLVTGGAGFIGSYVVEELLALNPKKIIIIDNMLRGSLENMNGFISTELIKAGSRLGLP